MKRYRRIIIPFVAVLLAAIGIFVLIEFRIKSIRNELSVYQANCIASSALTDGLDEALAEYKINYEDVVSFTYDESGNIKSISTDIIVLNNLGNEIGKKIDEKINSVASHEMEIPVSALLGGELTSGIGPKIKIYVTMTGITMTKFENNFESTGVNQTRHQIMLNVTVNSYVIFGNSVEVVPYNSNVCIAESVIVGITPQTFAEFSR